MKKVTILGGRRDGEEFEVPDHAQEIVFPMQSLSLADYGYSPEIEKQTVKKVVLSIQRRTNGKLFVQWPKDVN